MILARLTQYPNINNANGMQCAVVQQNADEP